MKSIDNIRTVNELLTFHTRHEGNWTEGCGDPGLGKSQKSSNANTQIEPRNFRPLEKRMDVNYANSILGKRENFTKSDPQS